MINTNIEDFNHWLKRHEDINLEFKEAKSSFNYAHELVDYCSALANEGGGKLILGVDNSGNVVGSKAFLRTHTKLSNELFNEIDLRIDIEELRHPQGRVLIFHVPGHYIGKPIKSNRTYWMRAGSSLTVMDEQTLKRKLNEGEPDFSSTIVPCMTLDGIDDAAVDNFKEKWAQKTGRDEYRSYSTEKVLRAVEAYSDKGLNRAALILFGKKGKIDELMPDCEIIFEWRHDKSKTAHDFRAAWREPFFKIYDLIWNAISSRNIRIPFQEGLFQREINAFNEKAVREALLNAVAHRDYSIVGRSIFIKVSTQEFCIESPGGFPPGITPENILYKTFWRNRRIAEILEKAELVERAGQGMDDIFESTIREGKGTPNFVGSDAHSVVLRIPAQIKDRGFILFLEKTAKEKQINLSFEEIFELEKIKASGSVANIKNKDKFLSLGIIEKTGRARGAKYLLSHHYYMHMDKPGVHTRLMGMSREQKKELIINHLKKNEKGFMKDFKDVFQDMSQTNIKNLLSELKSAGKTTHVGSKRGGYWILNSK